MAPPPPPPPPDLMPELHGEILVRFPPDHPAWLVRASLVCKTWRRLLCDPAFRRRYAVFHRAPPPLLGFLHSHTINDHGKYYIGPRFVSTTTTPWPPLPLPLQQSAFDFDGDKCFSSGWHVVDCRHGRVLLKNTVHPYHRHGRSIVFNSHDMSTNFAVWDIATGKRTQLPETPCPQRDNFTAAVLCAVRGCDHLDCHGGPFVVVYVRYNADRVLQSHRYSSEAGTWSSSASLRYRFVVVGMRPSVLIGDHIHIYFVLTATHRCVAIAILKVDWGNNHLSIIYPPRGHDSRGNAILMATEDGSLGFAAILGSRFCRWSRNVIGNSSEVVEGWAPCRVIELQKLIPFEDKLRVVGSAEGSGVIFISSDVGVFSLDLKSGRERKVDEPREVSVIFPFMCFYTPVSDGSS